MSPQSTQPNFDDFVKGLGITPGSTQPQTPSWSSKLQDLYTKSSTDKAATQQKLDHPGEVDPSFKASIGGAGTVLPNIAKTIGNIPSDALGTVGAAVVTPAKNIGDSLKIATDIYKDRGAVQGTKDIAAGFGDSFTAPGKLLVGMADKQHLVDHLSPLQDSAIKQRDLLLQRIADDQKEGKDTHNAVAALKIVQENLTSLNDQIGSKEDRQNKGVEDLTNIAKYPIEHPVQTAITADTLNPEMQAAISEKITPITTKVEQGVNAVKGTASDIASATSDLVSKAKGGIGNMVKGKTEAEILATPESQVKNLSASERKVWFDNEAGKINTQAEVTTTKIKTDLKTKTDATSIQTKALQKELATASRDKVIELRPKIVKAMGEQSKIYRNLIDEEMAGKENISINKGDLIQHIETQYADNPQMAQAIKDKLGVGTLSNEGQPTIHIDQNTTLGELFDKTKSLKQDISAGATKGTKTFTPTDKLTDDAIHTLTDFMKTKGVDFKEANSFWSKYAPIRNQLVTEAKPFLQTGTQTKTFANTLKRVAEGTDVNNENFINQVEDLVGSPINAENKAIVQKLSTTEKTALADKMESESKLLDAKMAKEKALEKLSSNQFEVERQARLRTVLKKVLKIGFGAALGHTVGGVAGETVGGVIGGAL